MALGKQARGQGGKHDAHVYAFMAFHVQRALARCEKVGSCLLWDGAMSTRGPVMTISQRQYNLRRMYWASKNGREIPPGHVCTSSCDNANCLAHAVPTTFSKLNQRTPTLAHRLAVSIGKRRMSKLSDASVEQIRLQRSAGVPARELAAEHNVSTAYVNMLVRGEYRNTAANPWAWLKQ